jgi:hypothetical protein
MAGDEHTILTVALVRLAADLSTSGKFKLSHHHPILNSTEPALDPLVLLFGV